MLLNCTKCCWTIVDARQPHSSIIDYETHNVLLMFANNTENEQTTELKHQ